MGSNSKQKWIRVEHPWIKKFISSRICSQNLWNFEVSNAKRVTLIGCLQAELQSIQYKGMVACVQGYTRTFLNMSFFHKFDKNSYTDQFTTPKQIILLVLLIPMMTLYMIIYSNNFYYWSSIQEGTLYNFLYESTTC